MPVNDIDSVLTENYTAPFVVQTQTKNPLSIPERKVRVSEKKPDKIIYTPHVCRLARKILWNEGGNLRVLAEYLGIRVSELYTWKKKHPAFKEACEDGVALSNEIIERDLRAVAVKHDEVCTTERSDGSSETYTRKDVVDVKAAIGILKARSPDWKDADSGGGITGNTLNVNLKMFVANGPTQIKAIEAKTVNEDEPNG